MTLSDVTFTEARTISGRKVNVIMGKGGKNSSPRSSVSSTDKVKTVVLEENRGYMEGLQHVVSSESPVKRISDIAIKPRARKVHGTMIKIEEVQPAARPRKPARTVAQSSSSSTSSSTSKRPEKNKNPGAELTRKCFHFSPGGLRSHMRQIS
ncbi:uncharacterized protein LOC134813617 isoform X2 [Bolinopsis microptera]|uniref:uncharacterized protein LOC134813617 isoform X2 n=1 Tax=Bolinopsis microptera TaxID=2820187 RepID=UPI003079103F